MSDLDDRPSSNPPPTDIAPDDRADRYGDGSCEADDPLEHVCLFNVSQAARRTTVQGRQHSSLDTKQCYLLLRHSNLCPALSPKENIDIVASPSSTPALGHMRPDPSSPLPDPPIRDDANTLVSKIVEADVVVEILFITRDNDESPEDGIVHRQFPFGSRGSTVSGGQSYRNTDEPPTRSGARTDWILVYCWEECPVRSPAVTAILRSPVVTNDQLSPGTS
jgi:hypothetical protein